MERERLIGQTDQDLLFSTDCRKTERGSYQGNAQRFFGQDMTGMKYDAAPCWRKPLPCNPYSSYCQRRPGTTRECIFGHPRVPDQNRRNHFSPRRWHGKDALISAFWLQQSCKPYLQMNPRRPHPGNESMLPTCHQNTRAAPLVFLSPLPSMSAKIPRPCMFY
jgi:hypothetical protein